MGHLTVQDILKATGGKLLQQEHADFSGLSIDSRTIGEGELFVALRGDRFDGHAFLDQALAKGAGALVDTPPAEAMAGRTIIQTGNTLTALQDIARFLRARRSIPVIAVTGTNGKTTTKELIASIFGLRHKVLKTTGNLNNHIGVPLCMTRMAGDEDVMVLELGSNAPGDIRLLCEIARPDHAVTTNVGPAHLEGFGELSAVRDTDLEVLAYAKTFAVNADDAFLVEGTRGYTGSMLTYGIDKKADLSGRDITLHERGSGFRLCCPDGQETAVELKLSGRFNITNALAAASVAFACGISIDDIKKGLEMFTGVPLRLELKERAGMLLIVDAYNANPASMEEALRELSRLKRSRTIAVLGDMLELGPRAEELHQDLVKRLNALNIGLLIAVGPLMQKASAGFEGDCYTVEDSLQAGAILSDLCREGDTILLKGSRGMKMELVLSEVEASIAAGSGYAV
ncbi:MAG: UDP-N-acetylmuramoyl-tripeptide--D-alanyl-D-alanine ligase [Nitrospirae bacterium]|nr:MAG: UDP-N-acetylmuramoyl-tripeptide--D-alanyl-D-alanine ligase [Nitrospirota bacterium]